VTSIFISELLYAQNQKTVRALVVFVQFKDDAEIFLTPPLPSDYWYPNGCLPVWAHDVFDEYGSTIREGTVTHFYDEMSYGDLKLYGEVYFYITEHNAAYYSQSQGRSIGDCNKEVINWLIAQDTDFRNKFDADGNGIVDCIVLVHRWFGSQHTLGGVYSGRAGTFLTDIDKFITKDGHS
jgi:hypothetical protein